MATNAPVIERQYNYRPTWKVLLLVGAFFGTASAVFMYLALTNDQNVVINGVIRLSPFGGRIFYGVLAAVGATFVAVTIFLAYARLTSVQRIALTRTGILVPTGKWNCRDEAFIAFKDIEAIKILEYHREKFIYIYASGLRYTVVKSLLAQGDFDEIMWALEANVPTNKSA